MKRRMMALFLTTAMIASMCACGSKDDEKKVYKVATDTTFAPFEFENDEGDMVGIDLDLLKAIAEDQGFEYELEYVGFSAAVTALEAGEVDAVIAGMSITDERKEKYDFSDPYFDSGIGMGVLAGSDIKSYEDLKGKQVAAKIGAEGCAFAESIADKYGFKVVQFEDSATMFQDVLAGTSAAVFDDYPVLGYEINRIKETDRLTALQTELAKLGFEIQTVNDCELRWDGKRRTMTDDELAAVSILLALVLGIIFGLFTVSGFKVLEFISAIYIDIIRGTPLLVQTFIIYYGLAQSLKPWGFSWSDIGGPFTAGVVALSLNAGAYMAEIIRGGIQSVDKGQMEAARSLGLPYFKAMRRVILPQAFLTMLPSMINQFIITLKDTSLISIIGIRELTQNGKIIAANAASMVMSVWLVVALFYLVICTILAKFAKIVERKIAYGRK